jgi:hypothetical protein
MTAPRQTQGGPRLRVERDGAAAVIRTDAYRLAFMDHRPRALLSAADGTHWSELSLLTSVDRLGEPDESAGPTVVHIAEQDDDRVVVTVTTASSAWEHRTLRLDCRAGEIRATVRVTGAGRLGDVTILGGRAVLESGAAGVFRSSIDFASVFVPTPTEPVAVVRSSAIPAQLGVVGDAEPGRLHAVFSPPPLAFGLGRAPATSATDTPDGAWFGVSVVGPVETLGFTSCSYEPLDGGFLLRLAYEGHTTVEADGWTSPEVVLRPADSALDVVRKYRTDLQTSGWAPDPAPSPSWHREPIFCGWGAQCALAVASRDETVDDDGTDGPNGADGFVLPAGAARAPELARQDLYDRWLRRLGEADIVPGTIVIDDRWQLDYGTNTVDESKWPDLRTWIADRHRDGQRVLLWFKAWDPSGLPADWCVTTRTGSVVSVDPSHPDYRADLARRIAFLLSPDGLDADGLKVDFTQRAPSGASLTAHADGVWGIAALHLLLAEVHAAARRAKPDALIVTHTVHPSFGDVSDMIRLNDVLERGVAGERVPVTEQLRFRAAVAGAALPLHLIDTDQWPMPDRAAWLDYTEAQPDVGVPALYYVESIDNSGERIGAEHLSVVAREWGRYRAGIAGRGAPA